MSFTATLLGKGLLAIADQTSIEGSKVKAVIKAIRSYPFKVIATFFVAPFLLLRLAFRVENPFRRTMAVCGILLSIVFAYVAGTFLGSLAGALFILSHYGPLMAVGFLIGSTVSVIFTVTFIIIILNSTSWLFLHLSSQEVIDHLAEKAK